jgi:hypothetical protein
LNNITFTALGASAFFNQYPVTDLSPLVEVVPFGTFERWSNRAKEKFGAPVTPPQQVNRLQVGYKDMQRYGRPATAAEMQTVSGDRRVQFFDIVPKSGAGAHHTLLPVDNPANSLEPVTMKLRSQAAHTSIPMYYLPYDLNHHRRITLVDKQAVGNVSFFMTDVVDGCSIYVEGTSQAPTVSHLNANAEHIPGFVDLPPRTDPANRKADWKHKAQHMNQRFHAVAKAPKAVTAGVNVRSARQLDYKDYGFRVAADEATFVATCGALQAAGRIPAMVGGVAVTSMELFHAAGTVFGVRNVHGQWSFHVQRRALVSLNDAGNVPLARQWVVLGVDKFWPTHGAGLGRLA